MALFVIKYSIIFNNFNHYIAYLKASLNFGLL